MVLKPPVGCLAHHYRTRFFILAGPLLTIVFIPLVGIAPAFLALILFISLGSIGSSMFHPTVAGMVSSYAGRHFGFSMSIFNMGALAFAVGFLWVLSKPGGLNIKEWLQPRNCALIVKSLYGSGGKVDLVFAWGRSMSLWEVTGAFTIEAHRNRDPGTQGRIYRDNVGKGKLAGRSALTRR